MEKNRKNRNVKTVDFSAAAVGTMLGSMVIAGFFLGFLVDKIFATLPIFLLIFGLTGFVGGMLRVREMVDKTPKRNNK